MSDGLQEKLAEVIERFYNNRSLFAQEVFGITPWSEQEAIFAAADSGERRIAVKSGHRIGKGHPLHLIVDTPDGRKRWGDIRAGERLFGTTGIVRVLHVNKRGVQPCYRVHFSDGTSTETDAAHLWVVYERRHVIRILTTEMMWREGAHRANGRKQTTRWKLPPYKPVEYDATAPFDPYLFGVWLGDGSKDGQITAHTTKANEMPGVRWRRQPSASANSAIGTVPGLRTALRAAGVFGLGSSQRFIPSTYKYTRSADRLAVLQGLMDTDGTTGKGGPVTYCSTSAQLAADVAWLVRSLSGRASINPTPKRPFYRLPSGERRYCLPAYNVSIWLPEHLPPFRMPSKRGRVPRRRRFGRSFKDRFVTAIEPIEAQATMCVTVDHGDGLYLTNDFIVTHNSMGNAILLRHWQITRFPQKCAVTAPSEKHLFDALWAEFRGLDNRFTPEYQWLRGLYETTQERSILKGRPAESFISIKVSRPGQTEALQGMYAPHVLLIADEASGIPDATFEAAMSSMANPEVLFVMTSQPIRQTGFFADAFLKNPKLWWKRTISSIDSPYCGRDYINFVTQKYGEDSNAYRIRILGEFPTSEDDKVIPRDIVLAAMGRDVAVNPRAPVVWGSVVSNVTRSALAKRRANGLMEPVLHWRKLDATESAAKIKQEWDKTPPQDRPIAICLNAIGIGRDVRDRLRALDLPARAINVAETPALLRTQYKDLDSELWFDMRDWLAAKDTVLPDGDEELVDELAQPSIVYYETGATGKETRESMKRRNVESPDLAAALSLTFAVNATVLTGQGGVSSWKQPARRIISGLG